MNRRLTNREQDAEDYWRYTEYLEENDGQPGLMSYEEWRGRRPMGTRGYGPRRDYRGPSSGQAKKRTGCSSGRTESGKMWVRGWNYSQQRGLVTFIAGPYSKTKRVRSSQSGKEWENWCGWIRYHAGRAKPEPISCMYEVATGRLIFKDLGMIANPKTDYFGTLSRKARQRGR